MDEIVPLRVDSSDGNDGIWSQWIVVGGACFTVKSDVSRAKERQAVFKVVCNEKVNMRDCGSKVDATIRIETGAEGKAYYTKYDFPCTFDSSDHEELFEFNNGEIYRNEKPEADKRFDNEVFSGFFQFTFIVHKIEGLRAIRKRKEWDHLSPASPHDKSVVLDDGTRFYILSQILSASSPYFESLFNNDNFVESKQEEVAIGEVSKSDFHTILRFIYPFPPETKALCDYERLESLIQLADRFDIPSMMEKLLSWIREQNFFDGNIGLKLMKWADQYDLLELQEKANFCLSRTDDLHEVIKDNYEYVRSLPVTTREKIFHALYLLQQRREEVQKKEKKLGMAWKGVPRAAGRRSDSWPPSPSISTSDVPVGWVNRIPSVSVSSSESDI